MFTLTLFKSEDANFVRSYSFHHKCDVWIHHDAEIVMYNGGRSHEGQSGYLVYFSVNSSALFFNVENLRWVCNSCGELVEVTNRQGFPCSCQVCANQEENANS